MHRILFYATHFVLRDDEHPILSVALLLWDYYYGSQKKAHHSFSKMHAILSFEEYIWQLVRKVAPWDGTVRDIVEGPSSLFRGIA